MNKQNVSGETADWQNSALWQKLKEQDSPEIQAVIRTLEQCMSVIQKVLAQGETAPSDFTLHDSGHAFRVAQRMTQIIPSDVLPQLSAYELSLLLLSAYLHDIGMTPERRKVILHRQYLLTGDYTELSPKEVSEFQKWLDNAGYDIVPPLTSEKLTIEGLRLAEEIITYYCRHCHNDWSEEWIRKHLAPHKLGTYSGWLDDLVALCRSHHYGYSELIQKKFDPRLVGSPAAIVHLRYLACVLRIADILEFDPERTPEVILRHRDISPGSLIYWHKDHDIAMCQEDNRLVVFARPLSARIHRALEVTVDQIDEELRLCRTLTDETHFEKAPGLNKDLPHRWDLFSSAHRDITARDGTYEYIQGAFRPDTKKLLTLLSGTELYGSPLAAVRELLQNAFDAVREQLARQRISRPTPNDPDLVRSLENLHQVDLRIEVKGEEFWLVCTDNGVGMTKAIIENHLLVSGAARRHDIQDLERRCTKAGFPLGRTGQFGIGVLSYFMIADRVEMRTRRSQEAGDSEAHGWQFETEGIGAFGELRRDSHLLVGTEVRLRLRPEVLKADDLRGRFLILRKYLKETLRFVPCRFSFRCDLPECPTLAVGPGWISKDTDWSPLALSNFTSGTLSFLRHSELLPLHQEQKIEADKKYWEAMRSQAEQYLRWEVQQGDLLEGLGRYRLHLPYFDLPGGASLGFLHFQNPSSELFLETSKFDVIIPPPKTLMSWKGMEVEEPSGILDFSSLRTVSVIVEIDWFSSSAGKIDVNRNKMTLSDNVRPTLRQLLQTINEMYETFLKKHEKSSYALLNSRMFDSEAPANADLNWVSIKPPPKSAEDFNLKAWGPLTFPAVRVDVPLPSLEYAWKGQPLTIITAFHERKSRDPFPGPLLLWDFSNLPPDRLVKCRDNQFQVAELWLNTPKREAVKQKVVKTSAFPSQWLHLCGVSFRYDFPKQSSKLWNESHPLLDCVDKLSWEWCANSFPEVRDPRPQRDELMRSRGRATAWFLRCLDEEKSELWEGLRDYDPSFVEDLWQLLFGIPSDSGQPSSTFCCFLRQTSGDTYLHVVTASKWETFTNKSDMNGIFLIQGLNGLLQENYGVSNADEAAEGEQRPGKSLSVTNSERTTLENCPGISGARTVLFRYCDEHGT